jgi:hypothetical protein
MARPVSGEIRDGVFRPLGEVKTWGGSLPQPGPATARCWRCGHDSQGHRHCEGCQELLHGEDQ